MIITSETSAQEVSQKLKDLMAQDVIPDMFLKNTGTQNGFISDEEDYQYWIKRVCRGEKS